MLEQIAQRGSEGAGPNDLKFLPVCDSGWRLRFALQDQINPNVFFASALFDECGFHFCVPLVVVLSSYKGMHHTISLKVSKPQTLVLT